MAAVDVQPSPGSLSVMANRRLPLASNPNAANSPFRGLAPLTGKRSRAQADDKRDLLQGQPPSKKQLVDLSNDENAPPRTLTRQSLAQQEAEAKLFMGKPSGAPLTAFGKKLAAAREKKALQPQVQPHTVERQVDRTHKSGDSLDNIRQWQKHYKKVFPQFVFYFESVPDDVRAKISRQVNYLGAKEEKFFSKAVTHIVTTRQIPPEHANDSPDDDHSEPKLSHNHKTINPSLLDRQESQHAAAIKRTTNLLDASLLSRGRDPSHYGVTNVDPRRPAAQSVDILSKARELGIKIWALEKLQRMMTTMFHTETGEQPNGGHLPRSHATTNLVEKQSKEADLQRLLRNEKITGPADRDMAVTSQDMCQLRGYYLYVHDMDEKTRPVMIREYSKSSSKDGGKWPQFRLSSVGRCPFIEDRAYAKKIEEEEKRAAQAGRQLEIAGTAPRTRSRVAAGTEAPVMDLQAQHPPVLAERQANVRRSPRKVSQDTLAKPLDPPKIPVSRQNSVDSNSMPAMFGSAQANMRSLPRFIGGEPVASGVQPSNVTSAIRSQVISSTAISSTAPGARMGTSKEIHALKRKVLERGATVTSGQTLTSSYMNDVRAALNGDGGPAPRAAKRRAQQTLGHINEEVEGEGQSKLRRVQSTRKAKVLAPKELKPGYCENCRDKFEDFDEHIQSRKHRKFAMTTENWTQLDELLGQLERPLKVI